ncbi:MAG: FMN-binding protein, partial [Burkholderiaceae bacterium]|nr:FMN-binding protein [Burkholderiaceae bacterium]
MNAQMSVPWRPAALGILLALFAVLLFPLIAAASSYETPLPAQLSTDPDLCAYAPCQDVMPDADSFSTRKGKPAYVEAYHNRKLIGYVFLSTDIVDIPAYSGKPVVTLLGMDAEGKIVGVKILKHSEPILLVGIPEGELTKFIKQFVGHFAWDKVEIGRARSGDGYIGIDAITGATVTVIAQNQVVMRSAYEIARQTGIVKPIPRPQAKFTDIQEKLGWEDLIKEGSVQHLRVMPKDLDMGDSKEPYMDLYFGYLNAPNVGRNVLGERNYQRLMADLKPNEHAIFIIANGSSSFKGSGFVRGGIYDR